jgi:hypothetical protein
MSRYEEIRLDDIKTLSIKNRKSKVDTGGLARPFKPGGSFNDFLNGLPNCLAASELKELVGLTADAVRLKKPVLVMMGAHVIKTGLSPIIVDLIERGIVTGLALNGAGAIHDTELAYWGKTSEDVAASLGDGSFGMVKETADILNGTVREGAAAGLGFGEAMGKRIAGENPPFAAQSILCRAYQAGVPVTVHVALGTDIVHQHPSADGAAIGEASLRDFRIFCRLVSDLGDGGVALLFGSTVILPEVFLKALTVARNLKGEIGRFTTANFDMNRHYRPITNVVERPNLGNGKGMNFTGHHEIMIPLLAAALMERLGKDR